MEKSLKPESLEVMEITFESLIQEMKGVKSLALSDKGKDGGINLKTGQR